MRGARCGVGVLAELEKIVRDEQGPLKLIVGGHSMGGAMAMFASWELAARLRKQPGGNPFTLGHVTYTFAAPRLGNDKFARLYNRSLPKRSDTRCGEIHLRDSTRSR